MSGKQQSSTGDNSATKQTKNNNHKSKKIIKKSLKFTKPQKTAKISANVNNNNSTNNNNNVDTTCNNNNNEKGEENFVVNDEIIEEFDFSDSDLAELNASSILSSSDGDTMLAIVEGEEAKEETVGLVQWSMQQELGAEHTTVIDNDGKQVEETEVEIAENSADNNDKHELSSTTLQQTATTMTNNEEEQSLLLPSTKCTTTETEFHGENVTSTEDIAASTFTSSSNQTNGNNSMAEAQPNGKTNTMLDLKSKQTNDSSSIVIPAAAVANDGNSCHNADGDENDDNGSEYVDEPYDELLVQFLDEANNIVSKSIVVITYIQILYIHIHIRSP